ncbi:MAG: GIY-YIG nuclease family protein [Patescibacteria group bacterium]|jgi:putative endonuclease
MKYPMYIVYVLQDSNGRFYKGFTSNLPRRLVEHQSGKTRTTARMENLKVVWQEQYPTVAEARKREKYFKSAAGRKYLQKHLGG